MNVPAIAGAAIAATLFVGIGGLIVKGYHDAPAVHYTGLSLTHCIGDRDPEGYRFCEISINRTADGVPIEPEHMQGVYVKIQDGRVAGIQLSDFAKGVVPQANKNLQTLVGTKVIAAY